MAKYGRAPGGLKVLAGLPTVVADSAQEAEAMYQTLQALIHPDVGSMRLGMDLGADRTGLPLDEPIPEDRIPKSANLHRAYFDPIVGMIREGLTLRQLYMRYERGNKTIRGTPKQVADHMENWFTTGAADGFITTFALFIGDDLRTILPKQICDDVVFLVSPAFVAASVVVVVVVTSLFLLAEWLRPKD